MNAVIVSSILNRYATRRTMTLVALVISLLVLAALLTVPREPRPRITTTLVKRVPIWGEQENGLVFSVSNSTSKALEVAIGLKQARPDYPRGANVILGEYCSTYLKVDASRVPLPWTVRIFSRRIPGTLETKARAFGARFRLCDLRPKAEVEAELIIKE